MFLGVKMTLELYETVLILRSIYISSVMMSVIVAQQSINQSINSKIKQMWQNDNNGSIYKEGHNDCSHYTSLSTFL